MICNKLTTEGKPCNLPTGHPNRCDASKPAAQPVMTKSGLEMRKLVDSYQQAKPFVARNLGCKKCKGRAANEAPDSDVEYSLCLECGGFLYTLDPPRITQTSDNRKDLDRETAWNKHERKTISGKIEDESLRMARLQYNRGRENQKPKPQAKPKDYLGEARRQAERDFNSMLQWNGY